MSLGAITHGNHARNHACMAIVDTRAGNHAWSWGWGIQCVMYYVPIHMDCDAQCKSVRALATGRSPTKLN